MPAQALIDRYRDLLLALLPPGDGFSRSPDSVFYDLMARCAIEFARIDERGADLLREGVPSTVSELLGQWEKALGLPDDCYTPTTDDERRAAVIARIVGTGGHSLADYTALAATLGYAAPVFTTYRPFVMGSRMGDAFSNGPWRSTAMVTLEPGLFDALIECVFKHQKMSHETLLFRFVYFVTVDGEYVTVGGERVVI